jgi:hypothetical protein
MSRRKPNDNSAAVSMFPFLAVLLCTMGALLVVLVAVSRSARVAALNAAQASQQAPAEEDPAVREKLAQIEQYVAKLEQLRAEAEAKLRNDQLRLGQMENHMRRLQDELLKLVHASMELDAMEAEHFDDRKQAERERERLQQLIAERQTAIDELKSGNATRKRTYSLVPYDGPNGTTRRPIIVECCKEGIVLQPEGTVIRRQDLQPPLGSGNALACALRAARDHYIQQHPQEGQARDTEPYPMLVIRPEGTELFGLARRAIEAADFDFGYEPVEAHWELDYGLPDPVLAKAEQQALEQARARQEMLAAAAPRAFHDPELSASGRFEYDAAPNEALGASIIRDGGGTNNRPTIVLPTVRGSGQSGQSSETTGGDSSEADMDGADGPRYAGGGRSRGGAARGPDDAASDIAGADQQQRAGNEGDPNGPGGSSESVQQGAQPSSIAMAGAASGGSPGSESSDQGAASSSMSASQASAGSPGSPNDIDINQPQDSDPNQSVAPNWSKPRKNVRAVAVRRPIRVLVRADQIGLVSDESRGARADLAGKTIEFQGDTVESMEEFVKAVEAQVDTWGIAGDNLYWRPVLEIQVGPGGQRRADDMARLLKNSDVEIQLPSTATNLPQGAPSATR